MLLRIDDVVSGIQKEKKQGGGGPGPQDQMDQNTVISLLYIISYNLNSLEMLEMADKFLQFCICCYSQFENLIYNL